LSAFHAAFAGAQFAEDRPGGATYNPRTGRIVVTVVDALAWLIESASGQLTGPDDVVLTGVLPATPFFPEVSLVTNDDFYIGEANFRFPHFAYGPLDLGRVAQPNIPMGDLVFYCLCPLDDIEQIELVRYVPEPTTLLSGWIAALLVVFRRSRGNARLACSLNRLKTAGKDVPCNCFSDCVTGTPRR
jgi:hypothetical protein